MSTNTKDTQEMLDFLYLAIERKDTEAIRLWFSVMKDAKE